jgi:hypothetical protein
LPSCKSVHQLKDIVTYVIILFILLDPSKHLTSKTRNSLPREVDGMKGYSTMFDMKRMARVRRQSQDNELRAQMMDVPYASSSPAQAVLNKFMEFMAMALNGVAAKIKNTALYIVWQEHLWPSRPLSITQNTCRSTGLGNLTCKMCTILLTHLGSVSGKRYTLMKNGDRKHGISQRFGSERCNGIIKSGKVLGFYTPELNNLQASSTSHRSKDATGSPLASVSANLLVGSPEASTTYCNCCHKFLNKAAYTGSPSASVSITDRAGSPSASAIYHIMDEETCTKSLRRASKTKSGIG